MSTSFSTGNEATPGKPTGKSAGQTSVTVVMATYNAMPFLPFAVESILNQSLAEWKLIIVNDGSTDGSAEYLRSIEDRRVLIVEQENQGQQAAANRAIELSNSEFIARMDADDIAEPTRLEKQLEFLNANPQVGLVGSQIKYISDRAEGVASTLPCQHEKIYDELIHNRHALCNSTTMFRTALFRQVGGYWSHDISEDWDLFLRMGEQSKLANINESLLFVRLHTASINGRRMYESQLHNEYACELARRRKSHSPTLTWEEFRQSHRYCKWPRSVLFRADCHSIAQYRIAVTQILQRKNVGGYLRLAYSMLCSPSRTFHRLRRMIMTRAANDRNASQPTARAS